MENEGKVFILIRDRRKVCRAGEIILKELSYKM